MISIIIPALNEAAQITATIAALQALAGDKEILLVDGGSSDHTVELARGCNVQVIQSQRGRGPQMHAGAIHAAGDIFWFVHADTVPPSHALTEIERALEDPKTVGGNFALVFDGSSRAARQLTAIYPVLRWLNLCYGDSGIFVRRDIYERIGGFRPLALFEDLDLLKRLRRAGRFVHLTCAITTSSRRFENKNFALVWMHWTTLQILYWAGISPNLLARWYRHARRVTG
jgi:rSAM/selenodomain-associated transferase 2